MFINLVLDVLQENMGKLNHPRTTLFVIDRDIWIDAKAKSESIGYDSVSEYLFSLLRSDLERHLILQTLLLELEKYYEYEHYTLSFVAENASLPLHSVISIMNDFNLPIPEEKSFTLNHAIHNELIKNKLLPREIEGIINLKRKMEQRKTLDSADILISLIPDETERTAEVLSITRKILLEILENRNVEEFYKTSTNFDEGDFWNLRSVFGKLGLLYDEEGLSYDPILNNLREQKAERIFGEFIEYSAILVIKRELKRIEEFKLDQIIDIEKPEMYGQEEEMSKQRDSLIENLVSDSDITYLKNLELIA